ncbi:hypothetical protein OQJ18_12120 [Fluoribacter dumoffii]|uniref:Uncharacterized protein n=1 Tax=Fluoribacter dumoffii TaxID=463 RepID=A0A377G5U1_9GAMM|nr:hypothetical protein [Fluoribacter dumoffii]KTC91543.1 hypothetical protein Ldum_2611 [Fluoribacter dumoffii NY 23]MCW8387333.1 hypothetical protein [Fluoribacter dumoffii]MCW8417160.1 hypothetical protein [Fluoribacter dumoffii]MCW8455000.1 hypothetical protein [Fluoribacter dumoffii]MCW8460923.1 hypothetical protein [Fluoribacter dumoffii]
MNEKRIRNTVPTPALFNEKNARTSHQGKEKDCKKKMSFFGDRGSRNFVKNEMVRDGLEAMEMEAGVQNDRSESHTPAKW